MYLPITGVSQLCVAVNKMDTVEWDEDRFIEITKKLGNFLKLTGFKEKDICYVPCSGLSGENLTEPPTEPKLATWYKGPTLVQQIGNLVSKLNNMMCTYVVVLFVFCYALVYKHMHVFTLQLRQIYTTGETIGEAITHVCHRHL